MKTLLISFLLLVVFAFAQSAFAQEGSNEKKSPDGGHDGERHHNHHSHHNKGGFDRVPVLPGVLEDHPAPKMGPCSELNLDSAQKARLKTAYFKLKEDRIDLEARLKKAHLKYEKLEENPDAEASAAEDATKDIVTAMTDLIRAGQEYRTQVTFEILKPAQRGPARMCMRMMKRFEGRHFEGHHFGIKHDGSKKAKHDRPAQAESGE